nr:MAG TPA: hypothetical protein [Caudoviricetes sp.]
MGMYEKMICTISFFINIQNIKLLFSQTFVKIGQQSQIRLHNHLYKIIFSPYIYLF